MTLDRVSFPSTLQTLLLKNTNVTFVRGTRFPKSLTTLQITPEIIPSFEIRETDFALLSNLLSLMVSVTQSSCNDSTAQIKALGSNTFCVITDTRFTELYGAPAPELAEDDATSSSTTSVVVIVVSVASALVLVCGFVGYRVYTTRKARQHNGHESRGDGEHAFVQVSGESKQSAAASSKNDRGRYLSNDVRNDPALLPLRLDEHEVELKEVIDQGGYGVVYRAIYRGHEVAIKRLLPDLWQDHSKMTRFMDEIRLCASLDHPKIVAFKGITWTSVSDLSAVIEYMPGGDLHNLLSRESSPSPRDWTEPWTPAQINCKVSIALDVAEAVVYLHSFTSPILHRDLKARNVLLDERGNAKLSDFGVSRELLPEETMTHGIGTLAWMAPEVLRGERYTEKADIYSLGVLLVELDRCRDPYEDHAVEKGLIGDAQLAVLVCQGKLRPTMSAEAPESVRWLADQCLSFDPDRRPTAMAVFYGLHQITQTS